MLCCVVLCFMDPLTVAALSHSLLAKVAETRVTASSSSTSALKEGFSNMTMSQEQATSSTPEVVQPKLKLASSMAGASKLQVPKKTGGSKLLVGGKVGGLKKGGLGLGGKKLTVSKVGGGKLAATRSSKKEDIGGFEEIDVTLEKAKTLEQEKRDEQLARALQEQEDGLGFQRGGKYRQGFAAASSESFGSMDRDEGNESASFR